uniref:Uncharacterized protein n=1 Tax=Glossina brevipalpis TaxID=37001 RepID=A0A1A9WXG8_9MUSC
MRSEQITKPSIWKRENNTISHFKGRAFFILLGYGLKINAYFIISSHIQKQHGPCLAGKCQQQQQPYNINEKKKHNLETNKLKAHIGLLVLRPVKATDMPTVKQKSSYKNKIAFISCCIQLSDLLCATKVINLNLAKLIEYKNSRQCVYLPTPTSFYIYFI